MGLPAPKVLVLEDSVLVAMAIEVALADCGLEAIVAGSIAAARDRLAGVTVAAALLDLQLPDGSSLELARELAERGCAVAICSGVDSDTMGEGAPAVRRFAKPVAADVLARWAASMVADGQGAPSAPSSPA